MSKKKKNKKPQVIFGVSTSNGKQWFLFIWGKGERVYNGDLDGLIDYLNTHRWDTLARQNCNSYHRMLENACQAYIIHRNRCSWITRGGRQLGHLTHKQDMYNYNIDAVKQLKKIVPFFADNYEIKVNIKVDTINKTITFS